MKVLVVSPVGTLPMRSGAAQAVRGYCTALESLGHEVHLAYHAMMAGDAEAMRLEWGERLHVIPYQHPAVAGSLSVKLGYRLRQWAKTWFYKREDPRCYNYRLDEWYDESLSSAVVALQRQHRFDVVIVNYVMLSRLFLAINDEAVVKILVTHDQFTDRNVRVAGTNTAAMWFSCSQAEEARGLERADKIIALQDGERADLQAITTKPVLTVAPWAQAKAMPLLPGATTALLFIGSDIPINHDGLVWFINEILPFLRDKIPGIQLKVAGRVCRLLQDGHPGVIKLGEVNNLDDAYAAAAIAINPVKTGTGLCIKSLEALSYGRPLVCGAAGARGLGAAEGYGLLMVETAADYVREIGKLIGSPECYNTQATRALGFIKDWNETVMDRLSDVIA